MFVTVKSKVRLDETGRTVDLPAVLTPAGILNPLLDYCLEHRNSRSLSWAEKVVRAVRLFLEYMHANPKQRDTRQLFENFADALYSGTFDPETRLDPSGLCWLPRANKDAADIINALNLFFDWQGETSPVAADINPLIPASYYDRLWNEAARRHRRDKALLGHLWSSADSNVHKARRISGRRMPQSRRSEPPAFPEDRFDELITDGFRVGRKLDHRGIAITLLMHGAGFRVSEPFHLYVEDVMADLNNPGSALVHIHHPWAGDAPRSWIGPTGKPRQGNRTAYLMQGFGLLPRTQYNDTRHAGWKGGLLDANYYMQAHWLEPKYGVQFMEHWIAYLKQIVGIPRPHPYAFCNLAREPRGDMYQYGTFVEAHAAACKRIGLEVRKDLGTTPHGHRHAYGRRLDKAGVDEKFIQIFMHHVSIDSQAVYTQASSAEVRQALHTANERLNASLAQKQALLAQ